MHDVGIQMKRKELAKTFYDDFKSEIALWSPCFIQKYFRVKIQAVLEHRVISLGNYIFLHLHRSLYP